MAYTALASSRMLALMPPEERDRLELVVAVQGLHSTTLTDLDVLGRLDAIDQIARHRRGQGASELPGRRGGRKLQVDRRLSRRVAAPDHDHVLARGVKSLEVSGRVVEAPALELLRSCRLQASIVGADGEHDATGAHLLAVAKHQLP